MLETFDGLGVGGHGSMELRVEGVDVDDEGSAKGGTLKVRGAERGTELLLSEDGTEVVGVGFGVGAIAFLAVDVPMTSECIRLASEAAGTESDDHVERREVLRPLDLMASEDLGGGKVL